jgi:hypothetical protein
MMNYFRNAVEGSAAQSFLNELFVFWSELNRHDRTLRPESKGVKSMISLREVDPPKCCARVLKPARDLAATPRVTLVTLISRVGECC